MDGALESVKRTYWNSVLARAEEDTPYRPARRLWRREKQGHYVPSRTTRVRVADERGVETFRPFAERTRFPLLDELARPALD